jgi:hypothetical protein
MRRVAVIGPTPSCGALTGQRFAELLAGRIGLDAFCLRPAPGLVLAAGGGAQVPLLTRSGRDYASAIAHARADTLIWLRFSPRAYLRDWLAGWLDVLLNGRQGSRRRAYRARLTDVVRACAGVLQRDPVDSRQIETLRHKLLFLELSSPEQAYFWLKMLEERVREIEVPRT